MLLENLLRFFVSTTVREIVRNARALFAYFCVSI